MAKYLFRNNATSVLRVDTAASSPTITLPAGEGGKFPSPVSAANEIAMLTLEDRRTGQMEIVKCTGRSADVLQVVRAQEGTAAQNFVAGATVSNRMTAATIDAIQTSASTNYLGPWPTPPTAGATGPGGVLVPNPIPEGSLYFNTTSHKMFVWDGTQWFDYASALPLDGHLAMTGTLNMGANQIHFSPAAAGNTIVDGGDGKLINTRFDEGTF